MLNTGRTDGERKDDVISFQFSQGPNSRSPNQDISDDLAKENGTNIPTYDQAGNI